MFCDDYRKRKCATPREGLNRKHATPRDSRSLPLFFRRGPVGRLILTVYSSRKTLLFPFLYYLALLSISYRLTIEPLRNRLRLCPDLGSPQKRGAVATLRGRPICAAVVRLLSLLGLLAAAAALLKMNLLLYNINLSHLNQVPGLASCKLRPDHKRFVLQMPRPRLRLTSD